MCVRWKSPPLYRADLEAMDLDTAPQGAGQTTGSNQPEPRTEPDIGDEDQNVQDEAQPAPEDSIEIVAQSIALQELNSAESQTFAMDTSASEIVKEALDELDIQKELAKTDVVKEEPSVVDVGNFRSSGAGDEDGDEDGDGEVDADGEGEGDAEDGGMDVSDLVNDDRQDQSKFSPQRMRSASRRSKSRGAGAADANGMVKLTNIKNIRNTLLQDTSLEATTIDLSLLTLGAAEETKHEGEKGIREYPAIKLPDLFPELPTYGPFVGLQSEAGNAKSSSAKNKDINKRVDETNTSGKVAYVSRLQDVRPVLVSTLQPAKKRKLGGWDDLAEFYPADDTNPELRPTEFYLPSPVRKFFRFLDSCHQVDMRHHQLYSMDRESQKTIPQRILLLNLEMLESANLLLSGLQKRTHT